MRSITVARRGKLCVVFVDVNGGIGGLRTEGGKGRLLDLEQAKRRLSSDSSVSWGHFHVALLSSDSFFRLILLPFSESTRRSSGRVCLSLSHRLIIV